MSGADFFAGVAVIIDDEVNDKSANIQKLLLQIKNRNMPYITYREIPKESVLEHWKGVSFVLLDWKLSNKSMSEHRLEGGTTPPALSQSMVMENISFLKKLKTFCFVPVFIFTNEDTEKVISVLKDNGLYKDNRPNYIYVKDKAQLFGRKKLFIELENWVKRTPSVYVLKSWEYEYQKSKTKLFHELNEISPIWPKILWDSFFKDGVNMSFELGEMISRNLYTRMEPFSFDNKILNKRVIEPKRDEVRKVFQGERFIKKESLHAESISVGDVFKINGNIFLNVRPDCDCVPDRNGTASSLDDVNVYLVKGTKLSKQQEVKKFHKKYGHFNEIDSQTIIFSMIAEETYDFRFKELKIMQWSSVKNKRVGRLLPPYITRIQQRYSLYIQRLGVPRIPDKIIR